MARVGEEFPLECPNCGGDIRLRGDGRQEPAHFEPEVRKRATARTASPASSQPLTHLGEPLEPPPLAPARGPPTDWGELVQAHDDRDVFQASPDELPAIDMHSL
jgi:hypothetical protein